LSIELDRAFEVLGVKPGVSDRELKAAHRDLAKVWHPDRFLNDPRLQEKAQEKLKEINEAYEQLISRHKRRAPPARRREAPASNVASPVRTVRRGMGWHWWVAAPVAMFAIVFALTTKTLLRNHAQRVESATATEAADSDTSRQIDDSSAQGPTTSDSNRVVRNRPESNAAPVIEVAREPAPQAATTPQTAAAVPTVTVSIDPANGLLATPDCPVKTRVTYPSGSEPRAYCNIQHIVKPEKPSGIKGLAKRIL
jgi:curved DNA-binding protein CbpA